MTTWIINSEDDDWLIRAIAEGISTGRIGSVYRLDTDEEPRVRKIRPGAALELIETVEETEARLDRAELRDLATRGAIPRPTDEELAERALARPDVTEDTLLEDLPNGWTYDTIVDDVHGWGFRVWERERPDTSSMTRYVGSETSYRIGGTA